MLRTVNVLVNKGHQVEIFTLDWQGDQPANIKIHLLPQTALFNYQKYQKFIDAAFKIIGASDFDYVMGYNRMAGLDAHFAADPCFVERAHQQRNALYRMMPRYRWFAQCEKAIFDAASDTQVLAVAKAEKPHFEKWYGFQSERFHYIPPYLSAERFQRFDVADMRAHLRDTFGFAAEDFVYLLTGSGFAMKGLDRAIKALAAMPVALRKNTRLVAIGQDKPDYFQRMAKRLGVQSQVVISKGRDDTPKLMQGADVCVHPAYRENTGLVILEGMACGTPMLVTESCGYAAHVQASEGGLVCPMPYVQETFDELWLTMRQTLGHDDSKQSKWAENGLQYAQGLIQANDGQAEANILIKLAGAKQK